MSTYRLGKEAILRELVDATGQRLAVEPDRMAVLLATGQFRVRAAVCGSGMGV